MTDQKWSLGEFIPFEDLMRIANERAPRCEEEKLAEERRQTKLQRKLLLLQICLASPWAIRQMAEPVGWRPQLSGQGLEEQIEAAQAMLDLKDAADPVREMAAQGLEDLENMPRPGHHMDKCPMWYTTMPTAQYWGSANPGLGFFHVEVEGPEAVQWLNMDNVGIVVINDGEITEGELVQNFTYMWKVNWFWQIRQLLPKRFLVRFPPSKKIQDLVEFRSINLKKKGVNVSFIDWEGESEPFEEFQEVWVNIVGIPAKWLTWKTICQVSTALGVLVNIDWHCIFRSFYRTVRVKVAVRDISKIPPSKLFEMEQGFFLIDSNVEEIIDDGGNDEDGNDDDENQQDNDVEEGLGDDFVDHINKTTNGGESRMDKDASTPTPNSVGRNGSKTVTMEAVVDRTLEMFVMHKVMENEKLSEVAVSVGPKTVEENIGVHLLQQFNEESDEDGDIDTSKGKEALQPENTPRIEEPINTVLTKGKQTWGPVQAPRMSSSIQRDGRTTIEKAQDIKKVKNLEAPLGKSKRSGLLNSFAALDNEVLHEKAKAGGINLGCSNTKIDDNINTIKKMWN
ncbi:hypothetical protein ACQ4PT_009744 [Festuca glaucescens]